MVARGSGFWWMRQKTAGKFYKPCPGANWESANMLMKWGTRNRTECEYGKERLTKSSAMWEVKKKGEISCTGFPYSLGVTWCTQLGRKEIEPLTVFSTSCWLHSLSQVSSQTGVKRKLLGSKFSDVANVNRGKLCSLLESRMVSAK